MSDEKSKIPYTTPPRRVLTRQFQVTVEKRKKETGRILPLEIVLDSLKLTLPHTGNLQWNQSENLLLQAICHPLVLLEVHMIFLVENRESLLFHVMFWVAQNV